MSEFPVDDENEKPKNSPPPSLGSLLGHEDEPTEDADEKPKRPPPLGSILYDDEPQTDAQYKKAKKRPPSRWSQRTYVSVPLLIAICGMLICAAVLLFGMFMLNGSVLCRFTSACNTQSGIHTPAPTLGHDPSPPFSEVRMMAGITADDPRVTTTPPGYSMPRCDANGDYSNFLMFTMGVGDNDEIFLMTPQGGSLCRLTQNLIEEQQVNWSPDRKRILFKSQRSDRRGSDLYVMNFDSTNIVNLTQDQAEDDNGSWSPDGKQIAFASNRSGVFHVYVMNADGSNVRDLNPKAFRADSPSWSPDGKQIVYIQGLANDGSTDEVFTVGVDTGVLHQLTNDSSPEYLPVWSPQGNTLAFYANSISALGDELGTDLYELRLNAQGMQRLTDTHDADTPMWSPDGQQLAFISNAQIAVLDLRTMQARTLRTMLPVTDTLSWR